MRLSERLSKGDHSFLTRSAITPQEAAGFKNLHQEVRKQFAGSRAPLLVRYKYQYRNLMQYGLLAEKDPGEKLSK